MKPSSRIILYLAAACGLFAAVPANAYDDGWSPRHHHHSAHAYCYDRTVAWAQSILNALGYHCGCVDGIMGWRTRQALIRYQCDHGLPHSGCLDAPTLCMLREE